MRMRIGTKLREISVLSTKVFKIMPGRGSNNAMPFVFVAQLIADENNIHEIS